MSKVKTSVSIKENMQSRIVNDSFLTMDKNSFSLGVENGFNVLDFFINNVLNNIVGVFNLNELVAIKDVIDHNREELLKEIFKEKPKVFMNEQESFGITMYFFIIKEAKRLRKLEDTNKKIKLLINLSNKINDLREEELMALVIYLFKTDAEYHGYKEEIAQRLLLNEQLEVLKEESNDDIPKDIPHVTKEDIIFSIGEEGFVYEKGSKIIIETEKENETIRQEIQIDESSLKKGVIK